MVGEWPKHKVIDLQNDGLLLVEDGNHGEYRPRREEFGYAGTSFIRAADMANGRVLFESAQKVTESAMARIRKGVGAGGDVILSHKGTVGKVAYVPLDAPPFVCSPQTTFWRTLDNEKIDRRYLYAFLNSRNFHIQLYSRANETDMAGYVSLTAQRAFKIVLPPIEEQRAIAAILGALDDKIELNRRMNGTLESLARAIFKSWFVDFDPVRWNAQGTNQQTEKNHSSFHLPRSTSKLFPSTFQYSELGKIPEGWSVATLSDIGGLRTDSVHPNKSPETLWEHYSIPAFDDANRPAYELGSEIKSNKYVVPSNCVLVSKLNPQFPRVWIPDVQNEQAAICSTEFMPFVPCKPTWRPFLYEYIYSDMVQIDMLSRATGSTGSRQRVKPKEVAAIVLPIPTKALIERFGEVVGPMHEHVLANLRESSTLSSLRDTLLPKLLSGEIRVGVAEKQVAKAI